jgi:hypothetical protein
LNMGECHHPWRLFILADTEMFAYPKLDVIKIVVHEFDLGAHMCRNSKVPPKNYFGWIRCQLTRYHLYGVSWTCIIPGVSPEGYVTILIKHSGMERVTKKTL